MKKEIISSLRNTTLDMPHKCVMKFWSVGCGACKALEPAIVELTKEYPDIVFKSVDSAKSPDDVEKYDVSNLPTLVFLRDGKMADKMAGLKPKSLIVKKIVEVFG